ncbi:MAG: dynamin family protein [Chloroflexota bacterium]|nr:dynamin family protein [Chloroflexota bacterium]
MQFTTQPQQLTTCPQCDNVVRIDAEQCNICGKRLRPPTGNARSAPVMVPQSASSLNASEEDEEYEDDDEYSDEDEEGEEPQDEAGKASPELPPAPNEIVVLLRRLQEQSAQMERYFPADLPNKEQKILAWKKQLQRACACAELFERAQFQQIELQQALKLRQYLAETARALDFTREYTVKLIGHAGAGKSTLLAALLGQDIFPRLAGGAVTGVRTRVRLCSADEPEEMRVHFLTPAAFNELLQQTQYAIKNAPNPQAREALAAELTILMKASEAFSEHYLKDGQPHIEVIPRERWKEESSRYIEEPARDSQEPRLVRLVEYVEYTLHAGEQPLLPPGSVLVDLPGGSAGQVSHEAILRDELKHVDALILMIGNNRFGDDERTQRIFEQIRRRVIQGQAPDVAARMIFLAVTHWDEINSPASLEKALGSLRPLLRELPPTYSSYHHHGPNNSYFFYPLRALDALMASLGIEKRALAEDRQQEGREYAGRLLSVYPELLKLDASLPPTAAAQEFQKVSLRQHEAMLRFSGLPELRSDVQLFLTENRYQVQLRQAETQLTMALQLMEDLCWEHMSVLGVHSHDLQELQQEITMRQSKRSAIRFEQLQQRTAEMHAAWNDALKQFDAIIRSESNAFQRILQIAHERAARRVKIRITQGYFDHFIKVGNRHTADSPAMEIGHRWTDIDGWGLIKELRISFSTALERELHEPARTLAEAFLMPIAYKEEIDGTLDLNRVALGEFGGDLDELHKAYNKLKRGIREKARDICLYVTMAELLNEEKYAPSRDEPAVGSLYRLIASQGKPDDIVQQARQFMAPILDVICRGLAESTERRITRLFRYELDKLETRQAYENDRLDAPPGSQNGPFADLVNRLYSLLTERALTSDALRQQLDALQAHREANVDRWIELIHDVEVLKTAHRQS